MPSRCSASIHSVSEGVTTGAGASRRNGRERWIMADFLAGGGRTGRLTRASRPVVFRGVVHYRTWEEEGSRTSREPAEVLPSGTATREVVPDRWEVLPLVPGQRV